jgi:hypothetical protein
VIGDRALAGAAADSRNGAELFIMNERPAEQQSPSSQSLLISPLLQSAPEYKRGHEQQSASSQEQSISPSLQFEQQQVKSSPVNPTKAVWLQRIPCSRLSRTRFALTAGVA